MLIAEHIGPDGALNHTRLDAAHGGVRLQVDEDATDTVLPISALQAVMRRYGKPLDPAWDDEAGEFLELGDGKRLQRLTFRAAVDVEPREYLVLRGVSEPIAALAVGVAAALRFLARRRRVLE